MNKTERAEKFVGSLDWIFAKTYAKFAPHEYIVKKYQNARKDVTTANTKKNSKSYSPVYNLLCARALKIPSNKV